MNTVSRRPFTETYQYLLSLVKSLFINLQSIKLRSIVLHFGLVLSFINTLSFLKQVNTDMSTPSHLVGSFIGDMVGGVSDPIPSSKIFFVPPNTLHLAADLKKLANLENWVEFYRNPVGIITVGSILALYALLLIWAHKRDKLDDLMVTCLYFCFILYTLIILLQMCEHFVS